MAATCTTGSIIRSTIIGNNGPGIRVHGAADISANLMMRGSFVSSNSGTGIQIEDHARVDLGTALSPGSNAFGFNVSLGLDAIGQADQRQIDAVGNMWRPSVQGADVMGLYSTRMIIQGPVESVQGNNFGLAAGWTLSL